MLVKPSLNSVAKIKVLGVGGGGCNAINTMISVFDIQGVEFIAINTDEQVLKQSLAPVKLQIGASLTKGLGAGGNPVIGEKAAQESAEQILKYVEDADMVFITGGMGGGTATGAIPVIAEIAKNAGALTVSVVTKPFSFEGPKRMQIAEEGINKLKSATDTLIVIPNTKLLQLSDSKMTFKEALQKADEVLAKAIESIAGLITRTGLINVDFADVKAILKDAGTAMLGVGQASGDTRATEAAQQAISNPLLEMSIQGAKGILINITAHPDTLTIQDVEEAAQIVQEMASKDAFVKFGAGFDESRLDPDTIEVSIIAAGFPEKPARPVEEQVVFNKTDAPLKTSAKPAQEAPDTAVDASDLDKPSFLRKQNIVPPIFRE